jgi:CheY-like chemotaxis protein
MFTCKILIVDDDPDDREILIDTLKESGVQQVYGVGSAQEAFAFLQGIKEEQYLPKLIVTDLNMPGINGQELLNALKEMSRYRHIPVIVCSTSSSPVDMKNCLSSGAKDYLTKPTEFAGYLNLTQKLSAVVLS